MVAGRIATSCGAGLEGKVAVTPGPAGGASVAAAAAMEAGVAAAVMEARVTGVALAATAAGLAAAAATATGLATAAVGSNAVSRAVPSTPVLCPLPKWSPTTIQVTDAAEENWLAVAMMAFYAAVVWDDPGAERLSRCSVTSFAYSPSPLSFGVRAGRTPSHCRLSHSVVSLESTGTILLS